MFGIWLRTMLLASLSSASAPMTGDEATFLPLDAPEPERVFLRAQERPAPKLMTATHVRSAKAFLPREAKPEQIFLLEPAHAPARDVLL